MRYFAAVLAIISLAAGAAVFLAAGEARGADRDTLVIGITQFPSTLNPNIDSMVAKSYVLAMTRRPITVFDHDWNLVCMLCVELPTIANGGAVPETISKAVGRGDGKGIAVTYTLRPDAFWGDGTPVTTADVLFTWEVGRHPLTGVSNGELYRRILDIEVTDDKTFTLHIDRIGFDYNGISDFGLLPAHLERPRFAAPREYRNRTLFDQDPTNPGLHFGPYRVAEVVSGARIVLEPNPRWYGKKPQFRQVVVRVIENTAALEANLLSGNIDYIAGELGVTIDQAIAFAKRHGKRFNIVYKAGLIYEHLDLNLGNPILQDRSLRHALIHAIDREAINTQLFQGRQPVAHSSVNPLDWVHWDAIPKYAYDPAKARKLLTDAGWRVGRGGIRRNAAGEKLTLRIMTTAGNRTRELVQQVLQSQWRQIGIDARIRNEPARVFFGQTVTRREYGGLAMYAWFSAPENVPRTTLHSTMVPTAENNWAGQNFTGYANPEMDGILDRIEVELDRDKRAALWRRLQEIYAEDLPVIPLYFRASPYIMPKWLKGVRPTGHQYPSTLWIEEWRAEGRG